MKPADALVLGSTPLAYCLTDGLRANGATSTSWLLPGGCTPERAEDLLRSATAKEDWAPALAGTPMVLSLWTDPDVHDTVAAEVLPFLAPGANWLQLGPHGLLRAALFESYAAARGVHVIHAPVAWTVGEDQILLRPSAADLLAYYRLPEPVQAWLSGLPITSHLPWRSAPFPLPPPRTGIDDPVGPDPSRNDPDAEGAGETGGCG